MKPGFEDLWDKGNLGNFGNFWLKDLWGKEFISYLFLLLFKKVGNLGNFGAENPYVLDVPIALLMCRWRW
jgi:hypothetical protein